MSDFFEFVAFFFFFLSCCQSVCLSVTPSMNVCSLFVVRCSLFVVRCLLFVRRLLFVRCSLFVRMFVRRRPRRCCWSFFLCACTSPAGLCNSLRVPLRLLVCAILCASHFACHSAVFGGCGDFLCRVNQPLVLAFLQRSVPLVVL